MIQIRHHRKTVVGQEQDGATKARDDDLGAACQAHWFKVPPHTTRIDYNIWQYAVSESLWSRQTHL